ncbi:MAG: NAD(P)-dependent glycerol-3-phosphate dehydrogenase [Cyclobacteriaceae bacterium]|nr:NAD(P)-dependent glycerol-3-phosphate dehydrogenase [Cyclobacteriaceae bacterium]
MASRKTNKPVGVIGLGSFGTAVSNLLARNNPVVLFGRNTEQVLEIKETRTSSGQKLDPKVELTNDIEYLSNSCDIIFPVVPSAGFRAMIVMLAPFLKPYHILIHGTKGFDVNSERENINQEGKYLSRSEVRTMSEVIMEESVVVRTGCLAGPNLAQELAEGQPSATVVASPFNEVIQEGQRLLRSDLFQVYGSPDLIGVELSGVLKNIIAIASGAISGLGLGENSRGLLISRGMVEMIYLGRVLGGNTQAFIGLAGIGDLVTTCTSQLSRNYTVGYRLAKGESLDEIIGSMEETAEGINTVKVARSLAKYYRVRAPITEKLYDIMFEGLPPTTALQYLMKYPFNVDIDFL